MIITKQITLSAAEFVRIRQRSFASRLAGSIFGLLMLVLMLAASATKVFAQTNWTRHGSNPVMNFGPSGSWDEKSAGQGSVLFDGTTYHMWYAGSDGTHSRIGHAMSLDGMSWTKDALNPVLDIGPSGSWDDHQLYLPCVMLVGSTFHMWYDGNDGSKERIGHATSPDGVNWTKDILNPVLDAGRTGSWEDIQVFPAAGSVIFDGTIYHMWYGGIGLNTGVYAIGHATSQDGTTWAKDNLNPVMVRGSSNEWDSSGVIPGTVLFDGASFHAWYSGHSGDFRYRIGYATSTDGVNWTRDTLNNPVLDYGSSGNWDFNQAWNGSVLFDAVTQTYKMWYDGGPFESERMGYATSLVTGIDDNIRANLPQRFELSQNYPNPFNPSATVIQYEIPRPARVKLTIYNVLGEKIRTLVDSNEPVGIKQVIWNGRNERGQRVSSGVYLYRLEAGEFTMTRRLMLMK